ncbi:Allergen V5/Tpx-1-like [Pseudomonas mandelii JR-1]|uniref:Allergen V5/Tpx-1-like n=3 Tax=Pseudomonas fluorescens group TaxID=136843 RepID=A0A024E5J5_9PSED|nr:Allergen V5/Tpx-1-like [Pseudomonas mandelii JR-1]
MESRIMGAVNSREISMRVLSSALRFAVLPLGLVFAATAVASEETQLVESINVYRSQVQRCAGQASSVLPPLTSDSRLNLSPSGAVDLQQAMAQASYPMTNVQAIMLSGPRDAQSAMTAIKESFCQVVLNPQFIDVGVSHQGRDWRIVLARPQLTARMGDAAAEGQKLLGLLNTARAQPRQCGGQPFAATTPLAWNATLAAAAEAHTRAMANNNFFDHKDQDGRTPGDRAELAGYTYQEIGENIAAGQDTPRKVVDGWLASPGHCANLMNPQFRELGAAYAVDPKSDAGIYWTAMFGTQ